MKKTFTTEGLREITTRRFVQRCKTSTQKQKNTFFIFPSCKASPSLHRWRRAKQCRREEIRVSVSQKDGCDCCSPCHTQSKQASAGVTYDPKRSARTLQQDTQEGKQSDRGTLQHNSALKTAQKLKTSGFSNKKNSLLCAVDELVFVGPLEAGFHSLVVPQLLGVIEELLRNKFLLKRLVQQSEEEERPLRVELISKSLLLLMHKVLPYRSFEPTKCIYTQQSTIFTSKNKTTQRRLHSWIQVYSKQTKL